MINAFATIGALALVFGVVFCLYLGLRQVIKPRLADSSKATLAELAEWSPIRHMSLREPNDHGDIVTRNHEDIKIKNHKPVGLKGSNGPCNPNYDAILEYNDEA